MADHFSLGRELLIRIVSLEGDRVPVRSDELLSQHIIMLRRFYLIQLRLNDQVKAVRVYVLVLSEYIRNDLLLLALQVQNRLLKCIGPFL